jgi:hypothetical protein
MVLKDAQKFAVNPFRAFFGWPAGDFRLARWRYRMILAFIVPLLGRKIALR